VNLLEAYPLIEEGDVDLSSVDYSPEILIIGGGLAGTSAAIWANQSGIDAKDILLSNKLRHGDANSIMAEGGTQAADRPNDSVERHFIDTMGGGHFSNDPDQRLLWGELLVKDLFNHLANFDRQLAKFEGGTLQYSFSSLKFPNYPHLDTP